MRPADWLKAASAASAKGLSRVALRCHVFTTAVSSDLRFSKSTTSSGIVRYLGKYMKRLPPTLKTLLALSLLPRPSSHAAMKGDSAASSALARRTYCALAVRGGTTSGAVSKRSHAGVSTSHQA